MTVRNGTAAPGPSTDLLGSLGIRYPDAPPGQDEPDVALDAAVRTVVERQRPPAPVTVRHVEPDPDPEPAAPAAPAAPVPARTAAGRARADEREDVQVARWRRDEVFEWMYAEGPQTIAEIAEQFEISIAMARGDIDQLRVEGRLERTGRERQGPHGGRPSVEFRAVVRDETSSHARTEPGEAEQPAEPHEDQAEVEPDPGAGDAAGDDRTTAEGHIHEQQGAPAAVGREVAEPTMTVHQQLTVRYIGCLIGWIERSSIVRDQGPPEHVYDRIERLLGIENGVA